MEPVAHRHQRHVRPAAWRPLPRHHYAVGDVGRDSRDLRFLRPVAFQGFPHALLPDELRDEPNTAVIRRVDGILA